MTYVFMTNWVSTTHDLLAVLQAGSNAGGLVITNYGAPVSPNDVVDMLWVTNYLGVNGYVTTNDSPTMLGGTVWTFALANVTNDADSGTEVVNWRTLTNHVATAHDLLAVLQAGNDAGGLIITNYGSPTLPDHVVDMLWVTIWTYSTFLTTNDSPTMADGTTWVFSKMRYLQEDYSLITSDTQLTIDDGGKAYLVRGTAEVTVSLPTNSSALSVGMDFYFVNLTTNILTIDAPDGFSIDDSDPGAQIYSGIQSTNYWPWSSIKLKQADSNWWHVVHARGDWTTTGTNATAVPPPVRGIGGTFTMTGAITNYTVPYGATYTADMYPVVMAAAGFDQVVSFEYVSGTRSNFTFRVRGAGGFITNDWDVVWNANPEP